jgi:hypothetical protein
MNTIIIILGVVLILVIVYMIFQDYFTGKTKLTKQVHLASETPTDIPGSDLSIPNASNVTYSIWIYVASWSTSQEKIIFSRNNDVHLHFDSNSASLKATIHGERNANSSSIVKNTNVGLEPKEIEITNNFPVQKWVCVLISIDNVIADIYLDGKLVKSVQFSDAISSGTPQTIATTDADDITFGNWDCYISKFERNPRVTDPKSAYDKYMEGNGGSNLGNALGNFNVKFAITKDNVETSKFLLLG